MKDFRDRTILVVDDSPPTCLYLKRLLERNGYNVVTTTIGATAAQLAIDLMPDLILLDSEMPDMDGLAVLQCMRKHSDTRGTPILMISSQSKTEKKIHLLDNGADDFIAKGVSGEELRSKIGAFLRIKDLQEELRARDLKMRQELDWAGTIQRRFLPEQIPLCDPFVISTVYRPAMEVGGDYYDFIPLARGRLGVVVADSTGHGVQAALCTALLKFAAAGVGGYDFGPEEILAKMNRILFQGLPSEIQVAATVAVLDPTAGLVRLAGAGLPRPLLVTRENKIHEQRVDGLLLGLVDDSAFRVDLVVELELQHRDKLLIFTDGVYESQNSNEEFYGENEIEGDLAALAGVNGQDLLEILADRALAFGLEEYRDDLTMIGISMTSS